MPRPTKDNKKPARLIANNIIAGVLAPDAPAVIVGFNITTPFPNRYPSKTTAYTRGNIAR